MPAGAGVGRGLLTACVSVVALLGAAAPVRAADFTVANTNDAGPGSLREAIANANGNGASDTIRFVSGLSGTITLTSGQLEIASPIDVQGPGANVLTVSANHASRVFKVDSGVTAAISGLTVADGSVSGGANGAAATVAGGAGGAGGTGNAGTPGAAGGQGGTGAFTGPAGQALQGGGIQNAGILTLSGVTVSANKVTGGAGGNATATAGAGGAGGTGGAGPAGGAGGAAGGGGGGTAIGGAGGAAQGGGVFNAGALTIHNSTVSGNSAVGGNAGSATAKGGDGGAGGTGGANSGGGGGTGGTGGNASATGGAGGEGQGGGVFNAGTLTIRNSTVSGNVAIPGGPGTRSSSGGAGGSGGASGAGTGGPGGPGGSGGSSAATAGQHDAHGGGILTAGSGPAALTSVTLATNGAPVAANLENRSAASLQNTIVSDPQGGGGSCQGAVTSGGYNIDSATSCGLGQPTDHSQTDPQLGALQDNGGPTKTRALAATSPAVDRGVSAGLSSDQRGIPRPGQQPAIADAPGGDGSDIGAFEILDTTRPVVVSASASPTRFAVNPRGPSERAVTAKRARKGTTFRYSLSERARIVFTIEQALPGRKVRGKCRTPSRSNRRKPRCTRYQLFGRFAQQGVAGANSKRFSGRIGRRKLRPGRYRVTLAATDPTGLSSKPKRLSVTVVSR